jgi:hypothetical protein
VGGVAAFEIDGIHGTSSEGDSLKMKCKSLRAPVWRNSQLATTETAATRECCGENGGRESFLVCGVLVVPRLRITCP